MDITDPGAAAVERAAAKARTFASLIELKHEHLIRTGKPRRASRDGGLRSLRKQLTPEDFETIGVLGRGAFAEVTLSRKRDSGAIYAIKRMRKADLVQRGHVERAWTEWMVQSEADGNQWLVKLHYCFQTAEHVYLVMDYVPGGDMMGLFMRLDTLPEADARFYAAQTVRAIESLHRLGYAHRDIKPDNLLLDAHGHLKLADLGLAKCTAPQLSSRRSRASSDASDSAPPSPDEGRARAQSVGGAPNATPPSAPTESSTPTSPTSPRVAHVSLVSPPGSASVSASSSTVASPTAASSAAGGGSSAGGGSAPPSAPSSTPSRSRCDMFSRVGTPDYMAPEVLTRSGYGIECDWWSFGCILFEMLVGYAPFYAETQQETADKVLRHSETLHFPPEANLSAEARSLIQGLLTVREKRLTVEGIRAHPFFQGVDWEGLRDATPPHTPTILSETDTQHFDEFEPTPPGHELAEARAPANGQQPRDAKAVLFAGFNYRRA